ncbi:MAG: DegT/DnrJ/EryC1/StrS family aminotransferase, partial [Acidimicrobiia bacterium]|nr:DegT/DnrJ/EryC1/StrS family aminotransferase [Acidimicrobiia bacterium]
VARLTGRRYAAAVGSGTDALFFSLRAAAVGPGDEVLVPDFSFVASASAIVRAGAVPVFVDIGDDFNLDLASAGSLVGPRTKAMVFVHLYGLMGNPEDIEAFGRTHGVSIIEDAAQSYGASFGARAAGSVGLASCLSFDPTKPISAPGSGGMVLTDDSAVADYVRSARYHGTGPTGLCDVLGFNSQMPSATASVIELKVDREVVMANIRRTIAARYSAALRGTGITPPPDRPEAHHIYHKYVISSPRRDSLRQRFADAGVVTKIHYPAPLSAQPVFGPSHRTNPRAMRSAAQVLSLPIHPYLTDEEIDRVVEVLCDAGVTVTRQ